MTADSESTRNFQEGIEKIYDLTRDIAQQVGVKLTSITLDDCRPTGASDYHVIDISAGEYTVSEKLHQNEIEDFPGHAGIDLTRKKIGNAVDRLKLLLEG